MANPKGAGKNSVLPENWRKDVELRLRRNFIDRKKGSPKALAWALNNCPHSLGPLPHARHTNPIEAQEYIDRIPLINKTALEILKAESLEIAASAFMKTEERPNPKAIATPSPKWERVSTWLGAQVYYLAGISTSAPPTIRNKQAREVGDAIRVLMAHAPFLLAADAPEWVETYEHIQRTRRGRPLSWTAAAMVRLADENKRVFGTPVVGAVGALLKAAFPESNWGDEDSLRSRIARERKNTPPA